MSIYYRRPENNEFLEEVRRNEGVEKLKAVFQDLVSKDPEKAMKLINGENIRFPSLFMLHPVITGSALYNQLSARNRYALEIANIILQEEMAGTQRSSSDFREEDFHLLKWILKTGYMDDGINDQYDEVLESAGIILAKHYKDKSCLRTIEEMIFNRNRRGAFIYDLIWAFFESSDPDDLKLLANRLLSSDRKDVELAHKLLNFIPTMDMNGTEHPIKQYQASLRWIEQNRNFLFYTGESNQQTCNPHRYAVSMEAKYLQRPAANDPEEFIRSLTEGEAALLDHYTKLDYQSRVLLSNCSSLLHRKNKYWWSEWLRYSIDKQIMIAKRMSGGTPEN